ncbi:MAG TPA: M14 family metallopeptidase [Gemmatimonadaceae bacterium]|nr:M14 family metallopeptidase [Gemmatimonadaceae bacterium]
MPLHRLLSTLLLTLAAGCAPRASTAVASAPLRSRYPGDLARARPKTRAEVTNFTETSRYADVMQFIDSLKLLGGKVHVGSIGKTTEGRDIPFVVASRPLVETPEDAKRLGRPIVYVQANIHAGEVEGKEALLALLRDLVFDPRANVLDTLVLVAVPIYNADGNERVGPQEQNRSEQNGPALVGTRANGQGLDLNRDYVKAEAPETRASLAMFRTWDPDVFVDLHTTDGSYHGYALTYAASLNPAARLTAPFTHDTLLKDLRLRMRLREGFEVFDYGNFVSQDSAARGWFTYDARPRFGTNYYGLRGRIAVLSEAYSHDPFARRVAATYDFVAELLSYIAEDPGDILDRSREANARTTGWGNLPSSSGPVAIRSTIASRGVEPVLVAQVERTGDTVRYQAGMPRGERLTGHVDAVRMPVYDHFAPTLQVPMPFAYLIASDAADSVLPRLALHGIEVNQLAADTSVLVQRFMVDSLTHADHPFQGHHEARPFGHWSASASRAFPAGTYVVRTGQPLGILAVYLLEPESDDGLVTWNVLDADIENGREYPVLRVAQPTALHLRPVSPPGR